MTSTQLLVVIAALVVANLPCIFQRAFLGVPRARDKSPALRLLELLILYLLLGGIAALFEYQAYGAVQPQGWAFYAITFCLFLVFAWPGFVWRYFWLSRHSA
ncbi:MAG TPA: DUF2818 family protein [Rhodocyclaceae bacterium]|jgi:hypothetical protein|nr:DUF2818 family protein [Rhodocyclaceae bacterium]